MTVSESQGRQFTVDEHVRDAYKYAGLMGLSQEPTDVEFKYGRRQLQYVMNRLEMEGVAARLSGFHFVDLVADEFQYTLPLSILDVLDPAMYIDENNADPDRASGETQIRVVTQEEYTRLSSKNSTGRPYLLWPDRTGDCIVINLWQIPDATGAKVRLRAHFKLHDTDVGTATLDLQRYWDPYIQAALAQRLAQSASLDQRAMKFTQEATIHLRKAKAKANQRPSSQVFVTHRGGGWHG